ncbi:MAG: response regulator transcription factor [Oscillospiraceae bacterium]|nr:response regulator transcription factor [Oscillospiraceae bacterium]
MKPIIFVVEDEEALQELYTYSLTTEFECRCFNNSTEFSVALDDTTPDLIILDVMLPGRDGFSILSGLKSTNKTALIPVIMVSAKGDEISKVKGLNMGADDYIAKPFGVLELIARVKANLRKSMKPALDILTYKDIVIDRSKRKITANNHPVKTTLKEFNLLSFLCKNAEKVQEREVIFNEVWGVDFIGESRTLDIHIKDIRKKLIEAESNVRIQTIRGVGYMLI